MVDLDKIRELYTLYADSNEANIKYHVVTKLLEFLGYDPLSFHFEHPMFNRIGRADIAIKIDETNYLFVETKSGNYTLTEKDKEQLSSYLYNKSLEWGILTNGRHYILINNFIKPLPTSNSILNKVVFSIDLFNPKDIKYLEYFRKENLFDNKITNYFRDIAQFKAIKYPGEHPSWAGYKGTLFGFFTYYANKEKRYRNLEEIRVDEFEEYLNHEREQKQNNKKSVRSKDTLDTKYSHIRSFFIHLKKYNIIPSHHFAQEKKKLIKKLKYEVKVKSDDVLNEENIEKIIDFIRNNNTESSLRNEVLLLLCLYMGLERSTLANLNWDMFDLEKGIIIIENRKIPLPNLLHEKINLLFNENKQKKIKGNYLFYTYYNKKYNKISESTINFVFEKLKYIDEEDEKWSYLSPAFIRNNLIKRLFYSNYSIEEIIYLTGSDLVSISKIISYDEIIQNVDLLKCKKQKKEHPFKKFLYK